MAAGVPVVATAVGGIPEIVEDGETGTLLAPPPEAGAFAAALEALLADPERRAWMGGHGRARWEERFSAERWAQRLRAVYEQALAEAGGRR
jgi:glycosyltransferase involved in cell wall biosynthesis